MCGQARNAEGRDRDGRATRAGAYPTARAIGEAGREARPSYFLHRGSTDAKGSVMTPGVLSVAAEKEHEFPVPPTPRPAGAVAASRWLVSPDNPLTARVMVNRLWQHHFGEGIVRTPSNFGKMGKPVASGTSGLAGARIHRAGLSLKAMHRLMLTSEAYQMSSRDIAANVAIDPENRFFWRMPRQRVEAKRCATSSWRRRTSIGRSGAERVPLHRSGPLRGELEAKLARQTG